MDSRLLHGAPTTTSRHSFSVATRQKAAGCRPLGPPAWERVAPASAPLTPLLPDPQSGDRRGLGTLCAASRGRQELPTPAPRRVSSKPDSAVAEPHKVFDEVVISIKSGSGGHGEIVPAGRGRYVPNHKYKPGGNQPKTIWLPTSDPGDGADGGDVVLVCDPGVDSLLHLHGRSTYAAPNGSNANPNTGSSGPKRNAQIKKARTAPLEIPVPPGTVVKRRGSGALVGELLQPGQRLTVARGGPGGHGVTAPSRQQNIARADRAERAARAKGVEVVEVEDDAWRADSRGKPGAQLSLQLLLRVVADVGLVGFPNAGKSSLLKALTRAAPAIAPYPFTTLMPNLGVMSAGGGENKAVLADLPGLIEGAHKGRGLGRNFLRHLRRTTALLHVVDGSAPDPATDYYAVREELRMYNPDYCARPHVVALNKADLLAGAGATHGSEAAAEQHGSEPPQAAELVAALRAAARRQAAEHAEHRYEGPAPVEPLAVITCSAATGYGLKELAAALQRAIGSAAVAEPDMLRSAPDTLAASRVAPPAAQPAAAAAAAAGAAAAAAHSFGWGAGDDGAGEDGAGDGADDGFDAAGELSAAEMATFRAQCRQLGLMDERGEFVQGAAPPQLHEPLDEQEQGFDGSSAAAGDPGEDDDAEWVDVASLDPETLAAVLAELERDEGDDEDEDGVLDLANDVMLGPDGGEDEEEEEDKGAEGEGEEADEAGQPWVRMAADDDPDAHLLALSTEQLLALEVE